MTDEHAKAQLAEGRRRAEEENAAPAPISPGEDPLRWRRIEAARMLGAQLADLLELCLSESDAEDWPTRQVGNTVRLYPGILSPKDTTELEQEIRRGIRRRWDVLTGRDQRDQTPRQTDEE